MSSGRYDVYVAADCNGAKLNLQFSFDQYGPSVAQLLSRATEAFSQFFLMKGIMRPFAVSSIVVFDEVARRWVPLERSSQLIHNAQTYVFQPDILDVPGEISDPIAASQFLIHYVSPPRDGRSPSPRAVAPNVWAPRSDWPYPSPDVAVQLDFTQEEKNVIRQKERQRRSGGGSPAKVTGPSILQEEREKVERLIALPVDEHRLAVRNESEKFSNSLSPQR